MGLTNEELNLVLQSFTSDRSIDQNGQTLLADDVQVTTKLIVQERANMTTSFLEDLILTDEDDAIEDVKEVVNDNDDNNPTFIADQTQSPTKIPPNTKIFNSSSSIRPSTNNDNNDNNNNNNNNNSRKENLLLLQGINIYVNGYTNPGRLQLHRLMTLYGGKYTERLTSKKAVSHIIATNLTPKKTIEFANYKVVKPEWITESIRVQKILPWQEYSLFYKSTTNITNNFINLSKTNNKEGEDDDAEEPITPRNVDCNHPDFLKIYYSKSRLHFLSTTKMLLQSKYLKHKPPPPMHTLSNTTTTTTTNNNSSNNKVVYYIDFDCFFAKVSSLMNPQVDIDKDCIIVSHGQKNADIASCNYVARLKYGIRNGEWVSSALQKCNGDDGKQELKILPYYFEKYKEISEFMFLFLRNKFDCIIPLSVDECIAYDYGEMDLPRISKKCEMIRRGIQELTKCTVSVGVSSRLYLSKLALKNAKPDGYKVVMSDNDDDHHGETVSNFLKDFQLTDLPGIGHNIVEKINTLFQQERDNAEITTISDLLKCIATKQGKLHYKSSPSQVLNSLGDKLSQKLVSYLVEYKDDDESSLKLDQPLKYFERKSISVDINYAMRFQNIDQVYKFLERVCDYLLNQLKDGQICTNQIALKIAKRSPGEPMETKKHMGMGKCDIMSKMKNLKMYTSDKYLLLPELKSLFHQLYSTNAIVDIRGLSVQLMKLQKSTTAIPKTNIMDFHMFQSRALDKTPLAKDSTHSSHRSSTPKRISPVKDYFANGSKRKKQLAVPDHIDVKVLKELPMDLQKELLAEYHLINKINSSGARRILAKSPLLSASSTARNSPEKSPSDPPSIAAPKIKNVPFQNKKRPHEIRRLLHSWIHYSIVQGPREEDKELFLKYCHKLLANHKYAVMVLYITYIENLVAFHRGQNYTNKGVEDWSKFLLLHLQPLLSQKTTA